MVHTEVTWNNSTIAKPAKGKTFGIDNANLPNVGPPKRGDVLVVVGAHKQIIQDALPTSESSKMKMQRQRQQ